MLTGRADEYELLSDEAAARWAKFGKSETVYYPMLLGLDDPFSTEGLPT